MAKRQAATTKMEIYENSTAQDRLRERFRVAVQFLLSCFDSMHHLEMTESICFVLEDVRTFLLEMHSSSRMEEFSEVPSTALDKLGFLKKKTSAKLDLTIVTKHEMLLLFVVYHLSLNGKSHFEEVVKDLRNRAPQIISMILSCASVSGKLEYLRKYPQHIRVDDSGHLELPSTFNLIFDESSDNSGSSEANGGYQTEVHVSSCDVDGGSKSTEVEANIGVKEGYQKESDVHLPKSNIISRESKCLDLIEEYSNDKTFSGNVGYKSLIVNSATFSEFNYKFLNDKSPILKSNTSNTIFSQEAEFQNERKTNKNAKSSEENKYAFNFKVDKPIGMLNNLTEFNKLCLSPDSDPQTMFLSGVPKSFDAVNSAARNENELSEISIEEKTCSINSLNKEINQNEEVEVHNLMRSYVSNELVPLAKKVQGHVTNRVCSMVREGIVFLFEHFKCRIDLHLVCVVLHALHEAKRPFLCLLQPEQIALVKKIIEPLWIAGVKDNLGIVLRSSSETFEMSNEQRNLLFISYAVGQTEELHCSTLLGMFEERKMDLTEFKQIDLYIKYRKDFFSIDESEYVKLENFPPAKWMAERLSSVTPFPADSSSTPIVQSGTFQMDNNIAIPTRALSPEETGISNNVYKDINDVGGDTKEGAEKTIEETQTKISGYSQETLNYLSKRIHDSIAFLLQFFELNVYAGLLEVVLHVERNCGVFFGLISQQQMEVIRESFRAFHIDGRGRVFSTAATKQKRFLLTEKVRMLLCMAFIVNRKGSVHYQEVFSVYIAHIGQTKQSIDSDPFEYFKNKEDIFVVSNYGYVSLVNISRIKFNYISILMSDRIPSPVFMNTGAVMPRMNPRPIFFNPGVVLPGTNYRAPIFNSNAFVPQMIYNPPVAFNAGAGMSRMNYGPMIFNAGAGIPRMNYGPMIFNAGAGMPRVNFGPVICNAGGLMPRMNCNPMVFNTGTLMSKTNCSPVLNSYLEKNGNEIPVDPTEVNAAKDTTVTQERNSIAMADSLQQNENVSTEQYSNYKIMNVNLKDEEKEANKVKESILYLSPSFFLEADDLSLIFCVLEDVKSYLLKLSLQARDDFVKKCVSHLVLVSKCCIYRSAAKSNSCNLNDEEKIALFVALLLHREKELYYIQVFDKFPQYNVLKPAFVKSILDQYSFLTKWKHIFSVSPNGNVKLLPSYVKNNESFLIDNVSLDTNKTNSSVNIAINLGNDGLKFDTRIKRFLEDNSTFKTKSTTCIKTKHCRSALRYYNRIKESIAYLGKTFEVVSAEQITKAIFYALRDVRDLFVKRIDLNKYILKALHLSFSERKKPHLPMDKLIFEKSKLSQDEKNLLVLVCILTETRMMHYQELFHVFESHGGYIATLTPKSPFRYLEKKRKCFAIDNAGDVSLRKNHALKPLNFKDVNLKSTFRSAVLKGSAKNSLSKGRKKRKSSSGCMQNDVLYGIQDTCNDVLSFYKQMRCKTKPLRKETGRQSSHVLFPIKTEPSTESTISIGATNTEHDFVSNETNLPYMKPTDVSTAIKDNQMIHISEEESSIASEFPPANKDDLLDHSKSVENMKELFFENNYSFMGSVKPLSFTGKDIPIDVSTQSNVSQVCLTFKDQRRAQSHCSLICQGETDRNIWVDSSSTCSYPNSSAPAEGCDKATTRNSTPIFNLLELLNDDDSPTASAKNVESFASLSIVSDCACTKDSTKELRTINFFIIILSPFKNGLSDPVLRKKLLLASSEVQHYISCVYKGNVLKFLQNHDKFYISPTSGNVCCKK